MRCGALDRERSLQPLDPDGVKQLTRELDETGRSPRGYERTNDEHADKRPARAPYNGIMEKYPKSAQSAPDEGMKLGQPVPPRFV